jgi:enamine deaminase RidA (YjgF/YER057c/UK114 family)
MSIQARLAALDIQLPAVSPPVAAFVPFVRTGNLVFLSGHIAKRDGRPLGSCVEIELVAELA